MYTANIQKQQRKFLPKDFTVTDWNSLEPFFKDLLDRTIDTKKELEQWLKDQSELEAIVSEDTCWRQIKMTCDTENKSLEDAFTFFVLEIQPKIQPMADALNKKLLTHPLLNELDADKYFTYLRSVKKSIELFREKNNFKKSFPINDLFETEIRIGYCLLIDFKFLMIDRSLSTQSDLIFVKNEIDIRGLFINLG